LQTLDAPLIVPGTAGRLVTARQRATLDPQLLLAVTHTLPLINELEMETLMEVPLLEVMVIPVGTVQV
jgi:hypothetical protein